MVQKASSKPIRKALLNIMRTFALKTNWQRITPEPGAVSQVIEYMVGTQQMCVPEQPEPASNLQAWLLFAEMPFSGSEIADAFVSSC